MLCRFMKLYTCTVQYNKYIYYRNHKNFNYSTDNNKLLKAKEHYSKSGGFN